MYSVIQVKKSAEELLQELERHQIELTKKNDELRRISLALQESNDRYLDLFEFAPTSYLVLDTNGCIQNINLAAAVVLGKPQKQLPMQRFSTFVHPECSDIWQRFFLGLCRHGKTGFCELTLKTEESTSIAVQVNGERKDAHNAPAVIHIALTDMSDRIKAEQLRALIQANLTAKEGADKQAQHLASLKEFQALKDDFEQLDKGMRILVKRGETDRRSVESNIESRMKREVGPFLQKMKKTNLDAKQMRLLHIIESSLAQLFSYSVHSDYAHAAFGLLTPQEMQVALLVRQGLSTKIISSALSVSTETVNVHRKHIRNKLGLKGRASNLQQHLVSLTDQP